jgi:hypothetical protein
MMMMMIDDDGVQGQAPCPACGATAVESVAHLMFECPVTTTAIAQMYDVIKAPVNGESKLQQCLNLSCDNKRVARFVSCGLWNGKHALVSKAIAMFLQKAWGIRNAYKHGTPVDVLSPPLRGAGPMALMLGHEWQHTHTS